MDFNIVREICNYLIANINDDISADDIATEFHYNKFYLMRKFKEHTGFTLNEFINECRIYNSTNPLIFTDDTILKIALNNGFNSLEYYSEKFKEVIGTSPLRFRKIYTGLLYIAETTKDPEELKEVRDSLEALEEYQTFLNNMGNSPEYSEEEPTISRPKIKIIKTNSSKAA